MEIQITEPEAKILLAVSSVSGGITIKNIPLQLRVLLNKGVDEHVAVELLTRLSEKKFVESFEVVSVPAWKITEAGTHILKETKEVFPHWFNKSTRPDQRLIA